MSSVVNKILIIDDEPLILSSLTSILSDRYNVITASEGVSGLGVFSENRPSLVLLDLNMPYINGVEVLARIREMDSEVPVLMMTGRGSIKDIDSSWTKQCAAMGVTGFVVKPISPDKLLRRIEKVMAAGGGHNGV